MSLSAITDAIKSRLNSPVLGNYILSLLLLNWRIPVYLISGSLEPPERIKLVEDYIAENWYWQSFVWALGITLAYLYVLPLLELGIKRIQLEISVFVKKKNNEYDSLLYTEDLYGVGFDVLGSALKKQLKITTDFIVQLSKTLNDGKFRSNVVNMQAALDNQKTIAQQFVTNNSQILNSLNDVLANDSGPSPKDIILQAKTNRENKVKATKIRSQIK